MNIFKLGLPVMFGMFGQKFIFYLYVNYVASLGTVQASSFIIINSCIYFIQIPLLGIAHLMTIKISQTYNNESLNNKSFYLDYLKLFFIELLIISLILILFNRLIFQIFSYDSQVLLSLISLKWEILIFFLMNVSLTFSMSCLRGYSDTFTPQIILLACLTMGFLFNNYILKNNINISGMLIIFSISGFMGSIILTNRIIKIKKQIFTNIVANEKFIKV